MSEENLEKMSSFVNRVDWVNAKTYEKKAPHSYVVKDNLNDEDKKIFEEVVAFIRDNGIPEKFYKTYFIYYYYGGYKYWTMGNPIEQTKIINRAKI